MTHPTALASGPPLSRGERRNRAPLEVGRALLLVGSFFLPLVAAAEAVPSSHDRPLSVEEAVVTALENNRALRVQRLSPLIAGTFEERERAVFDPRFFGEVSYSREQTERLRRRPRIAFRSSGKMLAARQGWRRGCRREPMLKSG